MTPELSRIALNVRSPLLYFTIELARRLKAQYGSTIHAYCDSPQNAELLAHENKEGLFASITPERVLLDSALATELDEKAVLAKAKSYEARLGCTYNFLAVSNRHLGRGYALGGFYHPRSRISEHVTYVQMLHAYNSVLSFWEKEIKSKGITAVINTSREPACVARLLGVPFRTIVGSRHKNYHYWAWNEHYETPMFEAVDAMLPPDARETMDGPNANHLVNRAAFARSTGLATVLKRCVRTTANQIYWRVKRHPKARGYYWSDNIRTIVRCWRDAKRIGRIATARLSDLNNHRFVFFPLHVEPEAGLQIISPEYFYQLSTIAALSRDLPAGVLLAVKEAFGNIGRRPANFYEQIADMKNVVLLDTMELGFDVVGQAAAVATISGSAGMEAAVMGKPVIAFGRHNIYNFLPQVRVVTEESKLKGYLDDALNGERDRDAARARGQRFLRAVVECSFDMGEYDYINLRRFSPKAVDDACASLLASLTDRSEVTPSLEFSAEEDRVGANAR